MLLQFCVDKSPCLTALTIYKIALGIGNLLFFSHDDGVISNDAI